MESREQNLLQELRILKERYQKHIYLYIYLICIYYRTDVDSLIKEFQRKDQEKDKKFQQQIGKKFLPSMFFK